MRAIFIRLSEQSLSRLREQARAERRRPQDQAAVLLERALRDVEPREREACDGRAR